MEALRMGVLGCSTHYFKRVAVPLRQSTMVQPYALASRDAAKAASKAAAWDFPVSYGSYEKLLADPKVDFIYNPLPNHMHLEWIKKAADAGKPTLCEKPLGLNAAEAFEAAEYCKAKGVPLMEAFMYRFHPQWKHSRNLVDAGEIGSVMTSHCVFSYNNKDPKNIRNIAAFGGGALLDIGCYAVSSASFIMGAEPQRDMCTLIRDEAFGTDVLVSGILDFGKGRRSTFTVGTQLFSMQRVDFYGTGGSLAVELPFNMHGDVPGRLYVATDVSRRFVETGPADQYLLQFDAFARALATKDAMPTPISDAIANMATLDALAASATSGAWEKVKQW